MKKIVALFVLLLCVTVAAAGCRLPSQPVQFNPINSFTVSATTSGPASVTIPGITQKRVHIYSIVIWCGANPDDSPQTTVIPDTRITDSGNVVFATPSVFYTSGPAQAGTVHRQFPVGQYHWSPGLTMGVGTTVVITGNVGGACGLSSGKFTFMHVQADQF